MANERDQFVIHRLRAKPVEYTIKIRHFVSGGEWMIGATVCGIEENARAKLSVVEDLRQVIEMFERESG